MGVSRVVPTIHPNFPIGAGLELHTREFAAATTSAQGEAGLLEAARALGLTVHALGAPGSGRGRGDAARALSGPRRPVGVGTLGRLRPGRLRVSSPLGGSRDG